MINLSLDELKLVAKIETLKLQKQIQREFNKNT